MKVTTASSRSRIVLLILSGVFLVVAAVTLHFVPIREEEGFIAAEKIDGSTSTTCEARTQHSTYRLILNEMPKYNQVKDKFSKNVAGGPCPPGVTTVISLYIF